VVRGREPAHHLKNPGWFQNGLEGLRRTNHLGKTRCREGDLSCQELAAATLLKLANEKRWRGEKNVELFLGFFLCFGLARASTGELC